MVRVPNPNPRPAPNAWPFDLNNPASNRASQAAQADQTAAQRAARNADFADDQGYRDRVDQTKQTEARANAARTRFQRDAQAFAVRNKVPVERAMQLLDPDNEFGMRKGAPRPSFLSGDPFGEAASATPRQSAVQQLLNRLLGRGGGALGVLGMLPMLDQGGRILQGNTNPRQMD